MIVWNVVRRAYFTGKTMATADELVATGESVP
jgi:hypothetical protein